MASLETRQHEMRTDYRAFLFDVDGTLIDSNEAHARAWTQSLREHGVAIEIEDIRPLIGMGGDKLLPKTANVEESSSRGKAIAKRKKEIFTALLPTLEATRGARALLEYLHHHGTDIVIATSADDEEAKALLEQAGLQDLIPKRSSKDDAKESKPDPDIVHAALAKSKHSPDESVLVGDTPYDIEAAHRAGIDAIALRCGGLWHDAGLAGAIALYDDPQDLLKQLS